MHLRYILAAILLAVFAVALFVIGSQPDDSQEATRDDPHDSLNPLALAKPSAPHRVPLPITKDAARLNAPDGSCREDIDFLELVISQYCKHLDGNPVGDNAEIAAALRGDNPKGIALLPQEGPFYDSDGRLVDRWGTPYFFHAVARQRMDIVSAGPDREFWTKDDLSARLSHR
jgi:hypothetical protein